MAKNRANGQLIIQLRKVLSRHDPRFSGHRFYSYLEVEGGVSPNSVRSACRSGQCYAKVIDGLAIGLSEMLREVWMKHPHAATFDPLKMPELGWLLERLLRDDPLPIKPGDLVMDQGDRYLIEQYSIRLAVRATPGQTATIERSGQTPELFPYNDLAELTHDVTFGKGNRRRERGYHLTYGTYKGRIKVLEPDENELSDDKAYRLHKRSALFEPDPRRARPHRLRLLIYGGYGPGEEAAHYTLAQEALYRQVSFTLDLETYREEALVKEPKLILVPVLTDRKYDCCDIARKGQGLEVDPDTRQGMVWNWRFTNLMNVLLCVRWETDRTLAGA